MINDRAPGADNVRFTMRRENGEVEVYTAHNLWVASGRELYTERATIDDGTEPDPLRYIAVGSDETAPADDQTALISEGYRKQLDETPTVTGQVAYHKVTLEPGEATGTIAEAGLFNAGTDGVMGNRVTHSPIPKGPNDSLTIEIELDLREIQA